MGNVKYPEPYFSRINVPLMLYGAKSNDWAPRSNRPTGDLDKDDPFTQAGGWSIVAPKSDSSIVRVYWTGSIPANYGGIQTWIYAQILQTAGTTHLASTNLYGYAVVNRTRLVRWVLEADPAPNSGIVSEFVHDFASGVVSLDAGPYENVFVVDSSGDLYSFGNNLAQDGTPGLLCQPPFTGANTTSPMKIASSLGPFSEVSVNGEVVLALLQNRSLLYACGRTPWTAPGPTSTSLTSWSFFHPVHGLPRERIISKFTAAPSGGFAVVDEQIFAWGSNNAQQSGTGRSDPLLREAFLVRRTMLAQRAISGIGAGYDFTVLASGAKLFHLHFIELSSTDLAACCFCCFLALDVVSDANNVYDPAATTYTLTGTSLADQNAIVELIYSDINMTEYFRQKGESVFGDVTAQCSVNSALGSALTCFPFLTQFPERQFSAILYGARSRV